MSIKPNRLAQTSCKRTGLAMLLLLFSVHIFAEDVVVSPTNNAEKESMQVTPSPADISLNSMENKAPQEQVSLSVEALKKQVIKLNRDLFILEEDLLFPANTQLVVYLSFSSGTFLNLDSISLKVDDEIVASHLYTERQLKALKRGGMQRVYMGNLKTGEHEVTATLHGIGPNKKDYKLAASKIIEKGTELTALEIRIEDQSETYQPRISIIEWEE